jgi:hypothetical protein
VVRNVKTYGAIANGIADDTLAVQNAINAASSGQSVYFPAGTYNVGQINVSGKTNITIYGDGPTSIIRTSAVAGLNVASSSYVTFRDFRVLGDYSVTTQRGITLNGHHFTFSRVSIYDAGFSGIFGTYSDSTFSGMDIRHAGDFGIQAKSGSARITITDSQFHGFASRLYPGHAIYFESVSSTVVTGNWITGVDDAPNMYEVSGVKLAGGSDHRVENNVVEDSYAVVSLPGASNSIVRGNIGRRIELRGFYILVGTSNALLENNRIEGAPQGFAFWSNSGSSSVTIRGNTLINVQTPMSGDFSAVSGLTVTGNSWQ